MIELQYLANKFNTELGADKFAVYLNTNAVPDENEKRTIVVMTARRIPFAISAVDVETLEITLTFDLVIVGRDGEAIATETALQKIQAIGNIIGWKNYTIADAGGEHYAAGCFQQINDACLPRIDTANQIQQITVTGNALVAKVGNGALISNQITTKILLWDGEQYGGGDDGEGYAVQIVSGGAELAKGTDEVFALSDSTATMSEVEEISRTHSYKLNILYTGSFVDKYFINLIEGGSIASPAEDAGDYALNETFQISKTYPAIRYADESTQELEQERVYKHTCKLLGGQTNEQAGSWFSYTLQFQKINDDTTYNTEA